MKTTFIIALIADDIIGIGVRYWAAVVRRCFPVRTP